MLKISRTLVMAFCAISIFACQSQQPVSVTIVQYNVGVFDKYAESGFDAIASVAEETGADVMTLNELDSCTVRTGGVYQLATFAQKMGEWNYLFASAMPYDGGAYGVGVASKPEFDVIRTDKIALPKVNGREPRAVAVVEYKDFVLCSTHLDLTEQSQLAQVAVINEYMDTHYADCSKPVFLGGDFNCMPGSKPIELMKQSWNLLTPESETYPADVPRKCIDFIFVRPNGRSITVESTSVPRTLKNADLSTASDHLPVVLAVSIK